MYTYNGASEVELMGAIDDLRGMSGPEQMAYLRQNPELLGFLPLLAAIPGLFKGAFKIGKNIAGLIKGKKKDSGPPPPPPAPPSPFAALTKNPMLLAGIGGGALLLIIMMKKK